MNIYIRQFYHIFIESGAFYFLVYAFNPKIRGFITAQKVLFNELFAMQIRQQREDDEQPLNTQQSAHCNNKETEAARKMRLPTRCSQEI